MWWVVYGVCGALMQAGPNAVVVLFAAGRDAEGRIRARGKALAELSLALFSGGALAGAFTVAAHDALAPHIHGLPCGGVALAIGLGCNSWPDLIGRQGPRAFRRLLNLPEPADDD